MGLRSWIWGSLALGAGYFEEGETQELDPQTGSQFGAQFGSREDVFFPRADPGPVGPVVIPIGPCVPFAQVVIPLGPCGD